MRRHSVGALVLAFTASVACAQEAKPAQETKNAEFPWAKDWESAKKTAADSKKLVMVDFYTDW
jgi:thiol:disulfide interchange protein